MHVSAHQHAGSDEERGRNGKLHDNHGVERSHRSSGAAAGGGLLDHVHDVDAARQSDGRDSAERGSYRRCDGGVREDAGVGVYVNRVAHVLKGCGEAGHERLRQPEGNDNPRGTAGERQDDAFGEQLSGDVHA